MDKEKIDFLVTVAENCGSVTLSREDFLQLVRERDEAVADLKTSVEDGICRSCKNFKDYPFQKGCRECYLGGENNFEWRGVQDG